MAWGPSVRVRVRVRVIRWSPEFNPSGMISGGGSDLRGCGGGTSRNLGLVWAFLRILGSGWNCGLAGQPEAGSAGGPWRRMANGLLPMVCGGAAGCLRSREGSRGPGGLPSVVGCQWPMANGTRGPHVVNDGRWLGVRACVRVCVRVRVHYPCARACAQPNAKGIANGQWVERPMANGRRPAAPTQWAMANG